MYTEFMPQYFDLEACGLPQGINNSPSTALLYHLDDPLHILVGQT